MSASRLCNRLYIISCLFFQLCFLTTRISSCGMSTHIDIAHQAINWFKDVRNKTDYRDIIMRHQDAFIGGNPYPDAMYSSFCFGGKFHSISEDTHWAPFLNATVRYIRKKYPKPWDQVCEKLIFKISWTYWRSCNLIQLFELCSGTPAVQSFQVHLPGCSLQKMKITSYSIIVENDWSIEELSEAQSTSLTYNM